LSPLVLTVFYVANQPFEVVAHVAFGTMLGFAFFGSGARRASRSWRRGGRSAGALP
jgi:hypothetical protein